jgi:hypothetical protein
MEKGLKLFQMEIVTKVNITMVSQMDLENIIGEMEPIIKELL